jgi:hypothetical protein
LKLGGSAKLITFGNDGVLQKLIQLGNEGAMPKLIGENDGA